jgi:hypothetical protein
MSMVDVRAAFERAGSGQLRLHHAAMRYERGGQVLDFTGYHKDGTPFAFVSAPFKTDPMQRAGEIGHDLVRAHTGTPPQSSSGTKPMPTPKPIAGLADVLRNNLAAASARAEKLATDVKGSVDNLHARLDDAEKVKAGIDAASADIQQALGMDNGGPHDDHA